MSADFSDSGKYDDIINLPNHRSKTRPHMSRHDRAAQFSPFAALSGHEAAVKEEARITHEKVQLTEEEKARLNTEILLIAEHLQESPIVTVTYFAPDGQKSGGSYLTKTAKVKKIDKYKQLIIMENEIFIPINDIISIELE
ncbi:MAG: hypothetical protein QM401_07885 [Bacillota bacterium]|nr:hypothetical protein [Bacillota bacterium]HHU60375.1 YolD-like family protein [Natronincola sp.]